MTLFVQMRGKTVLLGLSKPIRARLDDGQKLPEKFAKFANLTRWGQICAALFRQTPINSS